MSQTPEGRSQDQDAAGTTPERPASGSEHTAPKYVLHLGDLSVQQILRLNIMIEKEREEIERAELKPERPSHAVTSDELPPLRQYPHPSDYADSLVETWWKGMNELVDTDLAKAKEIATALKDSDNAEARRSAAFAAREIAPFDYEFARDIWRVLHVDIEPDVVSVAHHAQIGVEQNLTPQQVADLHLHFPRNDS